MACSPDSGDTCSWEFAGVASPYQPRAESGLCPPIFADAVFSRQRRTMTSPFRYFDSSPAVIRLVVMMYRRDALSLLRVADPLFERGIDIRHETVRLWWNRFGRHAQEAQIGARHRPRPPQPEAPPRPPRNIQGKTLGRPGRVARHHGPKAGRVWVCGMLPETG